MILLAGALILGGILFIAPLYGHDEWLTPLLYVTGGAGSMALLLGVGTLAVMVAGALWRATRVRLSTSPAPVESEGLTATAEAAIDDVVARILGEEAA